MPDLAVDQMTAATVPDAADMLYVVRGSTDKRMAPSVLFGGGSAGRIPVYGTDGMLDDVFGGASITVAGDGSVLVTLPAGKEFVYATGTVHTSAPATGGSVVQRIRPNPADDSFSLPFNVVAQSAINAGAARKNFAVTLGHHFGDAPSVHATIIDTWTQHAEPVAGAVTVQRHIEYVGAGGTPIHRLWSAQFDAVANTGTVLYAATSHSFADLVANEVLNVAGGAVTSRKVVRAVVGSNERGFEVNAGGNGVGSIYVGPNAGYFSKVPANSFDNGFLVGAPVASAGQPLTHSAGFLFYSSFWNGSASVTEPVTIYGVREAAAVGRFYLSIGGGMLNQPQSPAQFGHVIRGQAAQTAPLFQVENSVGTPLVWLSPSGGLVLREQTDHAAPAVDHGVMYVRDNGSGKGQLVVRFPSGAVQVLATEP